MKREDYDLAAGIVERMDKLEKTIFSLQDIMCKKSYIITAIDEVIDTKKEIKKEVYLYPDDIATLVFTQDILEYYINTLNLELEELRRSLEEI